MPERSLRLKARVALFALLSMAISTSAIAGKVSRPGHYKGYSEIQYDGWKRSSQYVAVSDGTKLAMDIFRPTDKGEVVTTPLPVIFIFTPYGRGMSVFKGVGGNSINLFTPVGSYFFQGGLTKLLKYGYVIACADVRGLGASFGARAAANDRTEARDAHDLIEWLGTQDFSNGKVGMWGASYFGQTVLEAITTMPPHLKAAYFGVTNFNYFDAWGRGGITRGSAGEVAPSPQREVKFAVPVDGDVDNNGDGYPDQLWQAVNEHLDNGPFTGLLQSLPYRDSLSESYESGTRPYWEDTSASNYLEQIKKSGVAAYIFGAWYDFLRRDTIMTFVNWPNPAKLLVTQGVHGDSVVGLPNQLNQLTEVHRFFDYWLKGIDNGVMEEPPVYYATVTTPARHFLFPGWRVPKLSSWQFASQWPPHDTRIVNLYLQPDKLGLTPSKHETSWDDHQVDYSISTSLEPVVGQSIPNATEFDEKGLTYTTEPLGEDSWVDGFPVMTLWVSSDNRDGDFFVVLEDVDRSGNSYYVSDGRLRASLAKTHQPPYDFLGLPWHRAYVEDENKLTPGEPVKLEMTMMPTSYMFKKGHRIRVSVVNSMGKVFNMEPQFNSDAPGWIRVYHDSTRQSKITLPVSTDSNYGNQ